MERERGRGQPKLLAQPPSRQTLRPGLNQQAEDVEPRFLGECRQSGDGIGFLHISIFMEI